MTTARLSARVDLLATRFRPPEAQVHVDLNLLTGAEADRLVALGYAYLAGAASPYETDELRGLLTRSITLTSDRDIDAPFVVPRSLELYWRLQRFTSGFTLPGGNFRFFALCFADRERLMDLSQRYGWEPDAESIRIAPFSEWEEDDVEELCRLLWQATSEQERSMWERRDGPRRSRLSRLENGSRGI